MMNSEGRTAGKGSFPSSRKFREILFPLYNQLSKGNDGEKYAATRGQGRRGQQTETLPANAAAEVRSRAARGNPAKAVVRAADRRYR